MSNVLKVLSFPAVVLCMLFGTLAVTAGNTSLPVQHQNLLKIDYGFYKVYYSCSRKGYELFTYDTVPDTGNLPRYQPFHLDDALPDECQQYSTQSYKAPDDSIYTYDRGHGNHQNIWDHDERMMQLTNLMTNIVPQESYQNRKGLWRYIEQYTECSRNDHKINVVGGNIWGNDNTNDYFVKSHGVVTPDYLFKILIVDEKDVYAWIIPNDNKAKKSNADSYLSTISEIEAGLGYKIPFIDDKYRVEKAETTPTWEKCDLS